MKNEGFTVKALVTVGILFGRGFAARGAYLSADAHERAHALALDVVLALIDAEIGIARPFAVYAQ